MQLAPIDAPFRLTRLVTDDQDWQAIPSHELLWMLQELFLIRRFEQKLLELKDHNVIHGPVHASIGQEAVAVGVAAALNRSDKISGTHRAHHQFLAKALNAHRPHGFNPLVHELTPEMQEAVTSLLAEIMGLAHGCSGGRGGSMHLYDMTCGVLGTNAIVAGGVPHATGAAWADRYLGRDDVTVCFFGYGALYQGVLHESANLVVLWKAPVIYFVENNRYAVSTRAEDACSAPLLCQVALAYNMRGFCVDGMNPLAVKLCVEEAVRRRNEDWLPCYVEAETYRYLHHAGKIAGSSFGYRDLTEENYWHEHDPLLLCVNQVKRLRLLDEDKEHKLWGNADRSIHDAIARCTETAGDGRLVVREALYPAATSLEQGLRDECIQWHGPFIEAEEVECPREIGYSDAIAEVTGRWLEKDPRSVVIGEDIANLGGGAYGATKGLPERFPGRVRNTPISEAGFCGLACGAALNGLHPIVELMFSSFALVAADQLLNQIGQLRHIYGGKPDIPLVVRTRVAIGLGYGAQHSLDPVALFSLFPGWRVFVPTNPFDYIGLFNVAMRSKSPVLIVEHHSFYSTRGKIPTGPLDHLVRPGRARIVRRGQDATVLTYGQGISLALEAANILEPEGISAEVLDLRTLDSAGLDFETIGQSLKNTNILITVEQAPATNSIGRRLAGECLKRFFYEFDGPPVMVAARDVPIPVSKPLEQLCLPSPDEVADAIRKAALRQM